jgi:hypothetical protein
LKWISNVYGIAAANSTNPCPWCHWTTTDAVYINSYWSIKERSHHTASSLLSNNEIILGYNNKAILDFIPFENCVVDILHMCLRITDSLFNHLHLNIEELDGDISVDLLMRPLLKMLWDFIEVDCKVTKPFYFSQKQNTGSKIKIRSLSQPERFKIIDRMFKNLLENQNLFLQNNIVQM